MSLELKYWTTTGAADLYDYSLAQVPKQQSLSIEDSTTVYRNKNNFQLRKYGSKKDKVAEEFQELFQVYRIRKRVVVKRAKGLEDLCLVVGNVMGFGDQGANGDFKVELKQGAVIKMGKASLEVIRIRFDKSRILQKPSYSQKVFSQKMFTSISQKNRIGQQYYEDSANASTIEQAPCCRYCYQKSIAEQNLLTILCKCEGSTKYVHEECLKAWILQRSKYAEIKKGIYRADLEGLKCQICKTEFDIQEILPCFQGGQKQYAIVLVENSDKEKVYWILMLSQIQDMEFVVGRKYQCQVSVADLSVSREHCCLKWDHAKALLCVEDLGSKFGTLLRKNLIQVTRPTEMQVGRTRFLLSNEVQQISWLNRIKNIIKKGRKQNLGNSQDPRTTTSQTKND